MSDYSIYPRAIDGYSQIPFAVDKKTPINAESVNRLRSGIINIQRAIGIAPQYSEKFGEFADLGQRLDYIENVANASEDLRVIVTDALDMLDQNVAEKLLEVVGESDISLTSLYERDGQIRTSEYPLRVIGSTPFELLSSEAGPDQRSTQFSFDDKFLIESRDSSLHLSASGYGEDSILGLGAPPNTIVFEASDKVYMPTFDSPEVAESTLEVFCSFGGPFEQSDLAILQTQWTSVSGDIYPGPISFVAGLNSAMDSDHPPSGLEFSIANPASELYDSPGVTISAADTDFPDKSAGNVDLYAGGTPTASGASLRLGGAGSNQFGTASLMAGVSDSVPGGGSSHIDLSGSSDFASGYVSIIAANGDDHGINGGNLDFRAGDGGSGGSIDITSGVSRSFAPSSIRLHASHSSAGDVGSVEVEGKANFYYEANLKSVSKSINAVATSVDGSDYSVSYLDYTLICYADSGQLRVHLPASPVRGRILCIKKAAGVDPVTILPASGTIEGVANYDLINSGDSITVQFSGSGQWWIIATS